VGCAWRRLRWSATTRRRARHLQEERRLSARALRRRLRSHAAFGCWALHAHSLQRAVAVRHSRLRAGLSQWRRELRRDLAAAGQALLARVARAWGVLMASVAALTARRRHLANDTRAVSVGEAISVRVVAASALGQRRAGDTSRGDASAAGRAPLRANGCLDERGHAAQCVQGELRASGAQRAQQAPRAARARGGATQQGGADPQRLIDLIASRRRAERACVVVVSLP